MIEAIAAQAAWMARPLQDDARVRVEIERSTRPRTRKGGLMDARYAREIEEWTAFAKAEPRSMKELIIEMHEMCGKPPSQASVYKWCEERQITIRIDRHKIGISKIGRELVVLADQGYPTSALIEFAASKGYVVDAIQIRSAVGHARRSMR